MSLTRFVAAQFRKPNGWFGSIVMGRFMNRVNRKITETTLDLLDVAPQHHVLEIGFGGGVALALLSQRVTEGLIAGADISPEMIRRAEVKFRREISAGRLKISVGNACQLPFSDMTFDRVFTINTIYFWPDTPKGFREIYRVLKPNGIAAIGLRSKEKMQTYGITQFNFRLVDPEEAADGMRQAGFRDVRIDHRDRDHKYDQVIVVGRR